MNFDNYYPYAPMPLPYSFDALKPYISEYTMYFHHDKHYKDYVNKLNNLLKNSPMMQNVPLEALTKMGDAEISRNAGGVYNHELYFDSLTPEKKEPSANMKNLINRSFGSEKELQNELVDMGTNFNGSGWIWLAAAPDKSLELILTPNQETIDFDKLTPLFNVDLWEHSYYLDKQNRRRDYLNAVMDIIDWEKAEERLGNQ